MNDYEIEEIHAWLRNSLEAYRSVSPEAAYYSLSLEVYQSNTSTTIRVQGYNNRDGLTEPHESFGELMRSLTRSPEDHQARLRHRRDALKEALDSIDQELNRL